VKKLIGTILIGSVTVLAIACSGSNDEPIKLMSVCSSTPAVMVRCTVIPLEEKHRTEAEQKLFREWN
jgi:hypothetical protein